MESDILQEVAQDEIPKVLEAMKRDWPQHFLIYQFVAIVAEYHKAEVQHPKQVLYKYGNFDDGVYVVKSTFAFDTESSPVISLFLYTTAADLTDFSKVLNETTRFSWTDRLLFELTAERLTPAIQQVSLGRGSDLVMDEGAIFFLPPEYKLEDKLVQKKRGKDVELCGQLSLWRNFYSIL
uniref:Uncharacterized protein n=1 Tax=Graphocephala atropunctata TaxID=36148 RepID=A0A1B6MAZ8_9HEMI